MAGIFINYRRDDAPGVAGRLFDHLAAKFSRRNIFMDVDAMKPGRDFVEQLDAQVSQCHVLLAVIGPHWLDAKDSAGRRRLDSDDDYVRIELASALKRDIAVIPVLVDGAAMPPEGSLPDDLKRLVRRHALELRHTRFDADARAVIQALSELVPSRRVLPRAAAIAAIVALMAISAVALLWLKPWSGPQAANERPGASVDKTRASLPEAPAPIAKPPNPATAAPAAAPAEGLRVRLGDSADRVWVAYGLRADLSATGEGQLTVPRSGMMFFFKGNAVNEIRVDPPFAGAIDGVRLGDRLQAVLARLGQALQPPREFGDNRGYIFGVGSHFLRCDFDKSGIVVTMVSLANDGAR
jgi:TIR domain